MNEIERLLPHLANVPWKGILIVAALLLMFGQQLPTLLAWLGGLIVKFLPLFGSWLIGKGKKVIGEPIAAVLHDTSAELPLEAAHELSEWAVKHGDEKALTAALIVYQHLQANLKAAAVAVALLLCCVGCSSETTEDPPEVNFGWTPPVPPAERQLLYGEPDESLRAQAPELFAR